MKIARVEVPLKTSPYPIYVADGLLRSFPALLARHCPGRRAVMVTDPLLRAGPAGRLLRSLRGAGWEVAVAALPRGEAAKTPAALMRLYGFLLRSGAERRTPLIAVGGGAVGDAAGFAAATYFRGMPLVHVPTTLLAQVDSAIGGKTAVNHPLAKNAIGAFHQPLFVAADTAVLGTLPRRQFLSGMAEVVKYALVFDPALALWLERRWEDILRREAAALGRMVAACAAWKARAVAEDERDLAGRRELLNFGHTLGHALEAAGGYRRFLHGEAVAWGMRFALALSSRRGWLKDSGPRRLAERLLSRLPAPALRGLRPAAVFSAMRRDKKVAAGRNVFVLLRAVGEPARVDDVDEAALAAAYAALEER